MSVAVHAATTALVDLLRSVHASDAVPVLVIDGPPDAEALVPDRVVAVLGAVGTSAPDALSLSSFGESFVLEVATSVDLQASGDEGIREARAAVVDLWAREESAVREHPSGDLGASAGGVLSAMPSNDWRLDQKATDRGRSAWVRWGVLVTSQRT